MSVQTREAEPMGTVIYHGTPMTPRAALEAVCTGRAMCVSFYRPDDVEAVEAISPAIMFRQRSIFVLEAGDAGRQGLGRAQGLDALLRVVGASPVSSRPVGGDTGYAGCSFPAQRRAAERVAVWAEGRAPVAHGRTNRPAPSAVRPLRPSVLGMDRAGQRHRLPRLSAADGRGRQGVRQPMADHSHDARNSGGLRLPVRQRGQHFSCTKRVAV